MTTKSSKQHLESLFEYDDYRVFLKEYFTIKKTEQASFSQRYFAKKAGFSAHNFLTLVLKGERNLSTDSIQKILHALRLSGRSATYFENLVYFNQTSSPNDKTAYMQRLKDCSRKTVLYKLNKWQFFYYEKWYYPVIRELLTMRDWHEDYELLAQSLQPPITEHEAKEAVVLLESSGFVCKHDGGYTLSNKFVTSEHVPVFIKKNSRREVLLKGIDTIETVAPADKYAAYSTVTMSRKTYQEVRRIMDDTRQKILALIDEDNDPDQVYEVVFQVFPVSNLKDIAPRRIKEVDPS